LAAKRKDGDLQQALDGALDELGLQNVAEGWLADMVADINAGVDDPALLEKLSAQWPALDEAALQERLTRLLFVAETLGRLEADGDLAA